MAQQALPQPDFAAISEAFAVMAKEFARFPNVPALDNGQQLIRAVADLQQSSRDLQQSMGDLQLLFKETDTRLSRIENHISAINKNSVARLENNRAQRLSDELVPLCAVFTNLEIEDFPPTLGDIDQLDSAAVNRLLNALNVPVNGTMQARVLRLRRAIGVFERRNNVYG
ncbi:hypothetical protein O1611_g3336 [Lasiodiplodia mahajangana]|uniref:Uncharacterized protein n=1 Tax=Lasiodiplodia mahajangana TaxID=1108764 RepID=A0ACC2JS26_9PEZI|nr:hypothetical protein O1611_g3336 [Lasiodiplodia mahajangana]